VSCTQTTHIIGTSVDAGRWLIQLQLTSLNCGELSVVDRVRLEILERGDIHTLSFLSCFVKILSHDNIYFISSFD